MWGVYVLFCSVACKQYPNLEWRLGPWNRFKLPARPPSPPPPPSSSSRLLTVLRRWFWYYCYILQLGFSCYLPFVVWDYFLTIAIALWSPLMGKSELVAELFVVWLFLCLVFHRLLLFFLVPYGRLRSLIVAISGRLSLYIFACIFLLALELIVIIWKLNIMTFVTV